MSLAASFVYRAPRASDVAWVKQTWVRGYRKSPVAKLVPQEVYGRGQDAVANRLLARSTVTVACLSGDDDTIVGWAALDIDLPVVHFVYITPPARRQGVCRRLISQVLAGPWWYTHLTDLGQKVGSHLGGVYDPFLIVQ